MFSRSTNVIVDLEQTRSRRVGILGARVAFIAVMAASLLVASAASAGHFGKAIAPGSLAAAFRGGYPELTVKWWTWATGIYPETPILDETGELCGQGQRGPVWFLAGSFGSTVVRDCTVPRWKTLFFPVFNTLWWVPEDGNTAAEVRTLSNDSTVPVFGCELRPGTPYPDGVCNNNVAQLEMEVLVDGTALEDIFGYRAQSPPGGSSYKINEGSFGNVGFGFEPGDRDPAVADGYWVMLRPLSRGEHTIVIRAFVPDMFGPGANFDLDVTYNLTVK